jgi:signal transduction histidine kinase
MKIMKKVKSYQRKLIVNQVLQFTILLHSILMATTISLVTLFFENAALQNWLYAGRLNQVILISSGIFVLFTVTIINSFVLTNKVAGPIYRLKKHMEDVVSGKPVHDLKFRKSDYFREILVPYNTILLKIRSTSTENPPS